MATLSVVLSLLAAFLIPAASATAATTATGTVSQTKNTSAGARTTSGQAGGSAAKAAAAKAAAAKPVDLPKPGTTLTTRPNPKAGHHQAASAKVSPSAAEAASGTADARQARVTAAKNAIARSAVADTCSGAISPDVVYPCSTPSASGTDTFTITLTSNVDLLFFELDSASAGGASWVTLTPPGGGNPTTCIPDLMSGVGQCATSGAGTYTVQVPSNGVSYTLSYTPLLSDTNCTDAALSFSDSPQQSTIAAGVTGVCDTLNLASGDVFQYAYDSSATDSGYSSDLTFYDATGAQVCDTGTNPCTLTGTAPYRVLFSTDDSAGSTLTLQMTSLTNPTGCEAVAQQTYGTVPDTSSTDGCRSISVATAGYYQVSSTNQGSYATTLYAPDGSTACTNTYTQAFCQLAAGTYDFVEDTYLPPTPVAFGLDFIAADESTGCTATGDTDFASGAASGSFAGVGQELCLTLPTASGLSDYLFDEAGDEGNIPLIVLDSTGAQQCYSWYQSNDVCALTGVAPFHVVLSEQWTGSSSYALLIQRTDSQAGCTAWPQSGFGGTWGATVTTVAGQDNYDCLSIPANQHSTGEMIDYADTTNTEDGGIFVADPTGTQACLILNTGICSYQAGVAYTAILSNSGQAQTYDLVRRDVSSTATCSTPASTAPGGAATTFELTSDLDTACYRVTAAATDDLLFSASASAPGSATATLQVTDANGALLCRQWGDEPCQTTGSTSYQVLVTATGYAGASIETQLDTWRVATASGWASQCAAHQLSSTGWAPFSGTISAATSGYCAVVSYGPNQDFAAYGNQPAGGSDPWLGLFTTADWTQGLGLCDTTAGGQDGYGCSTSGLTAAGQAVLMVTAGSGSQIPAAYTFQGVCQSGCGALPVQPSISAISPASQPARSENQITVTGANLNLGTQVMLATSGTPVSYDPLSSPVSVNAAGTSLTVDLDTSAVTPGKYDVTVAAAYPATSSGSEVLSGAYTVTTGLPDPTTTVLALGPNKASVQEWTGPATGWVTIGGAASALYVGGAGVFALTPSGSEMYMYNPGSGSWTEVGGSGAQFAVSGDSLYALAANRSYVARWNGTGTSWDVVGGPAQAIYPAADGVFATSPGNKGIYEYASGKWAQVGGAGSEFVTSGDELFGLGPSGSYVAEWNGTGESWSIVGGAAGTLYAGGFGMFATTPSNNALYQYDTATKAWTKVGPGGASFAVSQTGLYSQAKAGGAVSQYSGTPGQWTGIGGTPVAIVAG